MVILRNVILEWDSENSYENLLEETSLCYNRSMYRKKIGVCETQQALMDVFSSFISDEISDFNSNIYYSNPDYLKWSYLEGKLLD